jgi:hypothetical protein
MALITAGGEPMAPASPQPLTPSGLWVQGVHLGGFDLEAGQVVGARHGVVHVAAGQQLAGSGRTRSAPAAPGRCPAPAAVHLAFDDHRVDDVAEVVAANVDDARHAGLRVDLDLADVGAAGKVKLVGS